MAPSHEQPMIIDQPKNQDPNSHTIWMPYKVESQTAVPQKSSRKNG